MNANTCEPHNANAYLQREFTALQEQSYLEHLDSCESCREHLESVAGSDELWTEVQEFLTQQPEASDVTEAASEKAALPASIQQVIGLLQPTDDPNSMGRIDNFEILGVVGSGAMGVVLKAKDVSLDRVVALKVMNPPLAASGTARSRFEREAKAAAAVHHPSVVAIHGVRTSADLPYLVMPYLKGGSLQQRVDEHGPFSLSEILRIGSQIASGLAAAHRQGVVHRDIKPSNIMLDDGVEAAIITDFGLARIVDDATMTRTGVITGTPEFMSPEQARGDAIDGKSDIFSLGSVLYMLCTGYAPFRAQTSFGVLRKITDDTPPAIRQLNPEIPAWLCRIIEDLHHKHPHRRPNAVEAQTTLEGCLAHVYQPDQTPLPDKYRTTHTTPFLSRTIFIGALAMIAACTLLASMFLHNGTDKSGQPSDMSPTLQPAYEKEFKLAFADPKAVGELDVEMHRGTIKVSGHAREEVIVKLSVPYLNPSSDDSSKGLTRVRPNNLDFDIEGKGNYIKVDSNTRRYITNVEILVPYNTRLDLDSYQDGKLDVRNVSGSIRARSYFNNITISDADSPVDLYSYQGSFKVGFKSADHLTGSSFETYNGSIDVSAPADLSATVRYQTQTGKVQTDFKLKTQESQVKVASPADSDFKIQFDEFVTGTINGGDAELTFETTNGDILLRRQK